MATGNGKGGGTEVRTLAMKIPTRIHKALTIYCTLGDKPTAGIVALALERYLDANGDGMVKQLLRAPMAPK